MIIRLKEGLEEDKARSIAADLQAIVLRSDGCWLLVTSSSVKSLEAAHRDFAEETYTFDSDLQLASKGFMPSQRTVDIGAVSIGGTTGHTILIAGPCSVESEQQITQTATLLKSLGITALRAGCFKPRTSPYSFQGLGKEGLDLLRQIRSEYGLAIVTEVRDATHVDDVIETADVVQIGAKAMYDHGILERCGKSDKPVLLKRGFGTTLQEFVQAAEFILCRGNENVILCERGIRTFETKTRFTLDLCGVAFLKEETNLPIVADPSHAMGYAYGVGDLAKACAAMGVNGLLIEVHPDPSVAKSDASQQLDHDQFSALVPDLKAIAQAAGHTIV